MLQAHSKDPSTLASLHPAQAREVHYRGYRTSQRLLGSHFMTLRRPSRLPESGREYVPGDPVHLIDWKAYARTDQLIVREVRDEATSRVLIGVDVTETMQWPDASCPVTAPASKAEVAVRVAFHLAHLHLRMGDLVEIWMTGDEAATRPATVFKPRSTTDVTLAFERVAHLGFTKDACLAETRPETPPERTRDAVFWVGDALGRMDVQALLKLGRRSFLVHVLSSRELDISWIHGDTSYFDEGFAKKEYQGAVLRHRDNYQKHLASWRAKLERRQRQRGGDYLTVTDATQVSQFHAALAAFVQAPVTA